MCQTQMDLLTTWIKRKTSSQLLRRKSNSLAGIQVYGMYGEDEGRGKNIVGGTSR